MTPQRLDTDPIDVYALPRGKEEEKRQVWVPERAFAIGVL